MTDKFYSDIRLLIVKLKGTDNESIVDDIEDTINFSFTSTEMLLKLKFFLAQVNTGNLSDEILMEIKRIKNKVDGLLVQSK
ncbi:hypothetical protein [Enterobacter huaxiensis]